MYIHNITANIAESVHDEWRVWIKNHAQEILATNCFSSATMTQVLVEEEMGGVTYSIQFRSPSREDLDNYYKNHQAIFDQKAMRKFADKMLTFQTELKIVEEFFPLAKSN